MLRNADVALVCLLAGLTESLGGNTLAAQQQIRISDRPSCPRCEIVVSPSDAFGEESGIGTIDNLFSRGVRSRSGMTFIIGSYATSIKVFGPDARFVRVIGTEGDGPGEFRGIGSVVLDSADSLHVFDAMNRRHSVFSPSLQFVRSATLPLTPGPEVVDASLGRWIFNASIRSRDQIGLPLHLVAGHGALISSFGSVTGAYRPDIPLISSRALARASGGQVWSAHRNEYVIDLVEITSGRIVSQIIREASWFPSRMRPTAGGMMRLQPDPIVQSISMDRDGLLWVLVGVPDPGWKRAVRPPDANNPHGQILDDQAFWNTRVDVLDPVKGLLVATHELDAFVSSHLTSGVVGTVLVLDDIPRFHTWKLGLVKPKS